MAAKEATVNVLVIVLVVVLLDWTKVDLTPKSTLYIKEAVKLQDPNIALD